MGSRLGKIKKYHLRVVDLEAEFESRNKSSDTISYLILRVKLNKLIFDNR